MSFAITQPLMPNSDEIAPAMVSRLLLSIIIVLSVALLLWAALAKVDEVASAQGHVVPQRQLQIVSNLEGGVVKTILVKAGATVTAGQPLVELDNSQFAAEMGNAVGSGDDDTGNAWRSYGKRAQAQRRRERRRQAFTRPWRDA